MAPSVPATTSPHPGVEHDKAPDVGAEAGFRPFWAR